MENKPKFSRRNFLKKSGTGAGIIGIGAISSGFVPEASGFTPGLPASSPREVKVLTLSMAGIERNKDAVNRLTERIKIMSSYKPDIICLPEVFNGVPAKDAEAVPGPTTNILSSVAREMNCYIICPIHTKHDGKAFNSAVLIDRKGGISGQYDKIHPVSTECENGVTPGSNPPPVFKTDFGTIGMQICFDVNWTEEWKSLKEQGAEIIFWPSAFPAGRMLPSLAWMFKYYVVASCWSDPTNIYDITGDILASSGRHQHWAFANLNLEKAFLEIVDYGKKLDNIKKRFGNKVLIKYYHEEDWVTIESCSPELRLKPILEEYALVPHWDYIKVEEKIQDDYRKK